MTGYPSINKLKTISLTIITLLLISACSHHSPEKIASYYKLYQVKGDFIDLRDELVNVIEEKGMVVSFVSHAAKMLERTQSTVQTKGNLYAEAEVLLFCKADLSHQLAVSDIHSVILCPHAIAIYTLKTDENIVYMSIRNPPQNLDAYHGIFKLMDEVIKQVIEENS